MQLNNKPEKNETIAPSATKPLTINVGKFGTNPVLRYTTNTGITVSYTHLDVYKRQVKDSS